MKEIISEGIFDRDQGDISSNMNLIGNKNITSNLEEEKTTKIFTKKNEEIKLLKKLNLRMKNNIQVLENLGRKTILSNEEEKELDKIVIKIKELLENDEIPLVLNESKCKKCAYYAYCYI